MAAILFSTGGAVIKAASLSSWQVAGLRAGIAAAAILALIPAARRSWTPRVAGLGAVYAAMTISFVAANKLTTAASAILLQDMAPIYLAIAAPFLLKEHVGRGDLPYILLAAAGMAFLVAGGERTSPTAPNPALGNLIATGAGVAWAGVIGGLRWLERSSAGREPGLATVVTGCALAFAAGLPSILTIRSIAPADLAAVLYLGLLQIGLAYVLLTRGIRGVPAFEASLLLLVEPVLSPVWAWILHGERPGANVVAGGALILSAMALQAYRRSRRSPGR